MTVALFSGIEAGALGTGLVDVERKAKNLAAYALAIAGDNNALQWLRARSGRYGTIPVDVIPGVQPVADSALNGWSSEPARDDAFSKYQDAIVQRRKLGETLVGIGAAAGTVSAGLVAEGAELQASAAGIPPWALWAGLGLAAFWLFRRVAR